MSSILLINGIEFEHNGYSMSGDILTIQIKANSIEEIETAVGNSANLFINGDEFKAYGMGLYKISKEYENNNHIFYVDFIETNLSERIDHNSEDIESTKEEIEIINNAIIELAELLGGNE